MSVFLMVVEGYGQTFNTIKLNECYEQAKKYYPLIKQHDLIEKTKDYNVQNASKGYYPQFSINGQATYQSAVTTIPFHLDIPQLGLNINVPTPKKDQYKISGELDQLIYDGGAIKYTKESEETTAGIKQQSLEVELYTLKDRINQLFFGVLLIDEQLKQNELKQKDIQSSIDKIQERLNNGRATKSAVAELKAALIQEQQNNIQLQSSRKAYIDMLGKFTNQKFNQNASLETPGDIVSSDSINRPELSLYEEQKRFYNVQNELLTVSNRPKFSFFLQGGYGRPGLNAFDVNFATYYIGGLRLYWSLGGFYTLKNQRQILEINQQITDIQKETFLFNTNLILMQQNAEIEKLRAVIAKDKEIIDYRTEVKNASKAQMENGVVTMHEYISQLDAENLAKQNLLLHQVQL